MKEDMSWKEGYLDAFSDVLDMLQSIPETPEIYKIKESLRKTIEEENDEL